MRRWVVASAVVERDGGVLLVSNRRRDGRLDWSPPGGVIEVADGETTIDGLTREVAEETGLTVTEWAGPVWEVDAVCEGMGWHLRVEVHRALAYEGELAPNDPDGIVEDARFVVPGEIEAAAMWPPTREPLVAWLAERWSASRLFRYRVDGTDAASMRAVRLP